MSVNIMCRVSGGMTGTREALLKRDGKVREFESLEEAQKTADELNVKMNHEHSTAQFAYWPVEFPWQ